MSRVRRIAVTGGPGGGKTSVWQALLDRYPERLVAVPEVATLMFRHVFPSVQNEHERRAVQSSIYRVQVDTEAVYESRLTAGQCLLADRGTPDGGGYWPTGAHDFFQAMGSSMSAELARYDAVLFLETAAAAGLPIDEGNAVRLEEPAQAVAVDQRLRGVWDAHPRLVHVPPQPTLKAKVALGVRIVAGWLSEDDA